MMRDPLKQIWKMKDEDLEMDGPQLQLQREGDSSDDDEVSPIDNEDGEIYF